MKLGADQVIQGLPCKGGTNVFFKFYKRQPYLSAATLAATRLMVSCIREGRWVVLDRKGRLTDSRPPEWDREGDLGLQSRVHPRSRNKR